MKTAEFSVVIPHFNRPSLLLRAVNSVHAQTFTNFELIIVDDHSTMPLPSLPGSVRVIRRGENGGGSAARNDGIRASTGRYIAFLDSDDYWLPNRLFHARKSIANATHARTIFYEDVNVQKRGSLSVLYNNKFPSGGSVSRHILCRGLLQTSTLIVPNDGVLLFDTKLRRFQDLDFLVEAEKAGYRLHKIDANNVVWDLTGDSNRLSQKEDAYSATYFLEKHQGFLDSQTYNGFKLQNLEYWRKNARNFAGYASRVLVSKLDWRRKASLILR